MISLIKNKFIISLTISLLGVISGIIFNFKTISGIYLFELISFVPVWAMMAYEEDGCKIFKLKSLQQYIGLYVLLLVIVYAMFR